MNTKNIILILVALFIGAAALNTGEATYNPGGGKLQGQNWTANGFFIVPSGVTLVYVTIWGSGGGGGGYNTIGYAGGGGGGGEVILRYPYVVVPGQNLSIIIGAGGTGGAQGNPSNDGNAGTNTIFHTLTARGGNGGTKASATGNGAGAAAIKTNSSALVYSFAGTAYLPSAGGAGIISDGAAIATSAGAYSGAGGGGGSGGVIVEWVG